MCRCRRSGTLKRDEVAPGEKGRSIHHIAQGVQLRRGIWISTEQVASEFVRRWAVPGPIFFVGGLSLWAGLSAPSLLRQPTGSKRSCRFRPTSVVRSGPLYVRFRASSQEPGAAVLGHPLPVGETTDLSG
jgi:hypothetical protein